MSLQGGRTTACAGVPATVRRISVICGTSIGVCSVSTTTKSNPADPIASAVAGEPLESQVPIGVLPDVIARLNRLTGRSMEILGWAWRVRAIARGDRAAERRLYHTAHDGARPQ